MSERRIAVDALARVEGEGALRVMVQDHRVTDIQLRIYEPPRFFEAFLRGRRYQEAPDLTARICGICPVAYQMSAAHALEKAMGVTPPPGVRELRRLFYCGEWISSHVLHIFLLHLPDFLGHESALGMAADPRLRPWVERALRMKQIGNRLVTLIGGREIHPVNACVGGFYRAPRRADLAAMEPDLAWGLETAVEAVRFAAGLEYPDFEADYEFVSLRHPDEYPLNEGRLVSSAGLDAAVEDFERHVIEEQVAHSNALHARRAETGRSYLVGPTSRVNLNFDRLSPAAQSVAREIGLALPIRNPFRSLLARGLETVHAFEEALALVRAYVPPAPPRAPLPDPPRAGAGAHATEAPRGLLYHRYEVDDRGLVASARIVPPTSQNLKRIEDDLWQFVPGVLDLPHEEATWRCEQLVRCYDPCISCATHFLRLHIARA
ncbi:MAG: nickel-dependent hydrogenase large subunit [Armatimonadota bacterium]|nr:nickel-dependent hydrogenase large subunit [Armatimonadota bacterium]MDR7519067.1 nickel-dependent hydrogenase large subunit [Armatimonadota bacterium]MDR7550222.1 nickel-dependent hydrogenase large subunit [Armatimonadota bacterium]